MAKFKLVKGAGPHRDINGHISTAGQVIESNDDLVKAFPGKFERVSGRLPGDDGAEEAHSETHTPFDTVPPGHAANIGELDEEEAPPERKPLAKKRK